MFKFRSQYARCLRSGIDVTPFLEEITKNHSRWDDDTSRQKTYDVHQHTLSIPLRTHAPEYASLYPGDIHEAVDTPAAQYFPYTYSCVKDFASEQHAELGRINIVLLKPHAYVGLHYDGGAYYRARIRHHLVIQSEGKSGLRIEDRTYHLNTGTLWDFDNQRWHSAFNDGDTDRIHVIFDLRFSSTP